LPPSIHISFTTGPPLELDKIDILAFEVVLIQTETVQLAFPAKFIVDPSKSDEEEPLNIAAESSFPKFVYVIDVGVLEEYVPIVSTVSLLNLKYAINAILLPPF